jgi:RNA ligase (TIGR02306 family)
MSDLIVEVCKVDNVIKHPNADKLSIVTVKGWQCIVSLNQYKEGDLVVYCPPDSIIPPALIEIYKLEFLKKNGKVGTIKLRGIVSQGLILNVGPELGCYKCGENVAEKLGITKWEPPEPGFSLGKPKEKISDYWVKYINKEITLRRLIFKSLGIIKTNCTPRSKNKLNPYFDKYTDIQNIKHFPTLFKDGEMVVITEKIHGSNFRAGRLKRGTHNIWRRFLNLFTDKYEFVYGSHNVQKKLFGGKGYYKEDVYGIIAKRYQLDKILPDDCIVYGEIYGCGIQDLTYGKVNEIDVVFFDVKVNGEYLSWYPLVDFCKKYNLPMVPLLFIGKYTLDTVKGYTEGAYVSSKLCPEEIREGCVTKSLGRRKVEGIEHIGRKILKSISTVYLLRKGATENH